MNGIKKIEFDWLIHYKCNYRCPYCFFEGMWEEVERRNGHLTVKKWLSAWHRISERYKNVHLIITGGEPFMHPDFIELIQGLSKYFSIGFDTNLSCGKETLADFIRVVPPINISLSLSFHPLFSEFNSFLDKAMSLSKNGYDVKVQYVSYPPQLEEIKNFKDKFSKAGFHLIPLPFRGTYNGRNYPDAYTERERELIYNAIENLEGGHKSRVEQMLEQVKSKGRLCGAGHIYARIDADGTAYRCGHYTTDKFNNKSLGNIFDNEFELLDSPLLCEQEVCPCEFRWLM